MPAIRCLFALLLAFGLCAQTFAAGCPYPKPVVSPG